MLDEIIEKQIKIAKDYEEMAETFKSKHDDNVSDRCNNNAKEHFQIAELLKELKMYREANGKSI